MQSEIVMIGTELLLGQIIDTNAAFIAQTLLDNGIPLRQKTTVGDNRERIAGALNNALERSDVVICSGGLGPTEDDVTRECVAEVTARPLEYHEDIYRHIERLFARFKFQITENNKRQAYVPKDGAPIYNPNGTAPGIIVEEPRGVIICLPGVPNELKAMLTDTIIPYLRFRFAMDDVIHYRVLKVCALGESRVDAAIGDLMRTESDNPKVGLLANPEAVRIRISARAKTVAAANAMIDEVEEQVIDRLPGLIMGRDDDTIQGVIDSLLAENRWTLAVAETNSGGLIGQKFTMAGAKQYVGGSVIPPHTLEGRDMTQFASQAAEKVRDLFAADCGLAVVSDKANDHTLSVLVTPDGLMHWEFPFASTDERMQVRTFVVALEYLRRFLVESADAAKLV